MKNGLRKEKTRLSPLGSTFVLHIKAIFKALRSEWKETAKICESLEGGAISQGWCIEWRIFPHCFSKKKTGSLPQRRILFAAWPVSSPVEIEQSVSKSWLAEQLDSNRNTDLALGFQ
jgi:hypothetical protein